MRTLGRAFEFQRRIQDWKNELFLGRFVLPLKEENRKETRDKLKKIFLLDLCLVYFARAKIQQREASRELPFRFRSSRRLLKIYLIYFKQRSLQWLSARHVLRFQVPPSLSYCCGAVGRAVASNTRKPRVKSSHRQNLYELWTVLKRPKDHNKEKVAENGPFL